MNNFQNNEQTERIWIAELTQGHVTTDDNGTLLRTPSGLVAGQIWIIATVLRNYYSRGEKSEYRHVMIDDGTAVTLGKTWGEDIKKLESFEPGDLISITGRPRSEDLGNTIKVNTASHVTDIKEEVLHRLLILKRAKSMGTTFIANVSQPDNADVLSDVKQEVLSYLQENPVRPGTSLSELKSALKFDSADVEKAIISLIVEGLIYEPRKTYYRLV